MTISRNRRAIAGLLSAFALAAAAPLMVGAQKPTPAKTADSDWQNFGRDGSEQHYSPLDQVNLKTVGRLGLAWQYQLPSGNSVTGPVEADGKLLWDFDTTVPRDTVNGVKDAPGGSMDMAGASIAGGMMFIHSGYGGSAGANNVLLAFSVDGK